MSQTACFWITAIAFVAFGGFSYGYLKEKKGYGDRGATYLSLGASVLVFNFFPFIVEGGAVSTRSGQKINVGDTLFITGVIFVVFLWLSVWSERKNKREEGEQK